MSYDLIPAGRSIPDDINVVIEIPADHHPIKYEGDKPSGTLFVDRFLSTSMVYPTNYGFIPQTLSEDGDPIDVLVLTPCPLDPGVVIRSRPIGMLRMTDEAGPDTKILAVAHAALTPLYDNIHGWQDVEPGVLERITHFFEQYKRLEKDKWVRVDGWDDLDRAREEIVSSVERYHA
ncbi:inorganic diphosphatase [Kushneria phyllosphaerae]|uniref:Inorganic pyrophosphatase n=1 Tax=Kushneria phyllosphaerae TaxID=2100822 RepID=A0A2R8CHU9_9GAMM|nr:inorganic diphosphatase [Kushneria phyllosphaerae]SPJ32466.1 Inorganic pyrophosphatase [Kushneria phyllosphaerae]